MNKNWLGAGKGPRCIPRRVKAADKEKTAVLVNTAKGSRTASAFSEDLDVNVSTVSRILTGKTETVSFPLLEKIVQFAEKDSGVTLEQLMEAQGFVWVLSESNDAAERFEADCRKIIADELLMRGYSVNYERSSREDIRTDFQIRTDALGGEENLWMFDCKVITAFSPYPAGIGASRIWLNSAMAYYYRGCKAGRITIITDRRDLFQQMAVRMSKLCIPDEISVILISLTAGKVVDEYIAPLTSGREPKSIFAKEKEEDGNE